MVDFTKSAGELSKEVENVANTLEEVDPIIGQLNADVASVASDIEAIYDKAQIEELVTELEKYLGE